MYKLLGIQEKETVCEFCKKQHIAKVWTVQNLTTGEVHDFGSQCVKKAFGVSNVRKMSDDLLKKMEQAFIKNTAGLSNAIKIARDNGDTHLMFALRKLMSELEYSATAERMALK